MRRDQPPSSAPTHSDPGLQPERTTLAWGRTTLAMVVVAGVFLRWMPRHGVFTGILVAVMVAAASALFATHQLRHHHAVSRVVGTSASPMAGAMLMTSATVIVVAALGIFTVLFLPVA